MPAGWRGYLPAEGRPVSQNGRAIIKAMFFESLMRLQLAAAVD